MFRRCTAICIALWFALHISEHCLYAIIPALDFRINPATLILSGTTSIFIPNEGIIHKWSISAAVTLIWMGSFVVKEKGTHCNRRNPPQLRSSAVITKLSKAYIHKSTKNIRIIYLIDCITNDRLINIDGSYEMLYIDFIRGLVRFITLDCPYELM